MPLNKDQMLRYQVLNACFKDSSRYYDINALVECCQTETMRVYEKGVSKRSVQNDIALLQLPPYNVEFDEELRSMHYYRYADTSFNIEIVADLSRREKTALHDTVDLLRPMCDDPDTATPLMRWMFMSLQRLESGRPIAERSPCVSFENNGALAGMGNFNVLLESIMNHQPVTLRYKSFKSKTSRDINVYPYHLKQYNSRWYLIGTPDGYENIASYALDRILTVTLWKSKYRSSAVDLDKLFADTIGVSVNPEAKVERVVLKIDAKRYPYVETKPFSEKQKIVKKVDDTVTISFPMKVNKELIAEILSFGNDIEVVDPVSLREEIARQVSDLSHKYQSVQKDCTRS